MRRRSFILRMLDQWPIKLICMAAAGVLYILFRINTLTERQVTLPLNVLTPEGFVVSSEYPGSVNVTLRGDTEDIDGVIPDDIEAFLNLTLYPEAGEFQIPVEFRKKGTALQPDALEMRSRPREVTLAMERRTVRSLTVRPDLSGFPALGYELTQFFVSPSSVTAVGPQSQMSQLDELKTELIDLSGRRSDFTASTRLVRPSGQIELPGGEVVEFRGVVDEAVVIRTIADREVVVFDLSDGLVIEGELPRVTLTVQGSQLTVEGAKPSDMTFYVDGSAVRRPGTYSLPLKMDIPSGLAVLRLLPREIELVVRRQASSGSAGASAPSGDSGSDS